MQKIILFFLAFFAVNFIFSQGLDDMILNMDKKIPILDSDGTVIYELLPQREKSDIYYSDELRDPCPPCRCLQSKPAKKSTSAPKPSTTGNINIINISTTEVSSVEIENFNGNTGGVNVKVNAGGKAGCPKNKVDTVVIHDDLYWHDKIKYPFIFGDSIIMSPIDAPIALPNTLKGGGGNYFHSNPNPDSGNQSGGTLFSEKFMFPFWIALLIGGLMFLGHYLLNRSRSFGTSSVTSITSETSAPPSKSAPIVSSSPAKTETPVSEIKKEETEESKSRNRQHYRDLGNERKSQGGEEEAG